MKIAIVGHTAIRGGAEHVTRTWLRELHARGHEVALYGVDMEPFVHGAEDRVSVTHWIPDSTLGAALNPHGKSHLVRVRNLRRELKQHGYDVCLAMQTYPALVTLASVIGLGEDRPRVIVSERNIPSVLLKREGAAKRTQLFAARKMYRFADAAIAISHPVAADLVSSFSLPAERVYVVPNPSMVKAKQPPVPHLHSSSGDISIILPFRLVPQKQPMLAVSVAAELAGRGLRPEIVCYGVGPLMDDLRECATRSRVAIRFEGWVEDWASRVPPSSVVLLPSFCEGFGNVLIEAASAGIPSVALSSALGVADALIPGLTGVLSLSDQPRVIANAVEEAAALEVDVPRWLERFSVGKSTDLLTDVFEEVVSR